MNPARNTVLAEHAEKADSFLSRGRGLLGRDGLEEGTGLWLVPGTRIHMCGMRFPIDVVFLSRSYKVTACFADLAPQPRWAIWRSWGGGWGSYSCLELPAGTIAASQTQTGDQLDAQPQS